MSTPPLPNELCLQIFSHGIDPMTLAPTCRALYHLIPEVYKSILSKIQENPKDSHRFFEILAGDAPDQIKIREIFLKIASKHRIYFQKEFIHPELPLISHKRFERMIHEIRSYEKLQTLSLLNGTPFHYKHLDTLEIYEMPEEINALSKLQDLNLSYNYLSTLPIELFSLTTLKKLNLTHNQLAILPEEISQLKKLNVLNISHNHLQTLPKGLSLFTEENRVFIHDNPITSLPRCFLDRVFPHVLDQLSCSQSIFTYRVLSKSNKLALHLEIWRLAKEPLCYSPSDWGNIHLLSDLPRFERAVDSVLHTKWNALTGFQKNQVFQKVHPYCSNITSMDQVFDHPKWLAVSMQEIFTI